MNLKEDLQRYIYISNLWNDYGPPYMTDDIDEKESCEFAASIAEEVTRFIKSFEDVDCINCSYNCKMNKPGFCSEYTAQEKDYV